MFSNGNHVNINPADSLAQAESYARRARFLRQIWHLLGPAQREHVTTHCEAVSRMAGQLGRMLWLDDDEIGGVQLAGLLHDIGKCAVPEVLIAKPERLTPNERRVMDHHVGLGARIARALGADARTAGYIRGHHVPFELIDGDPAFSRGARVLCVADALASMLSHRAYSPALSVRCALGELRRCAGSQFDPLVVECAQGLTGLSSAA